MPIGDGMLHGLMPYRDLVDHKGPILYFIHAIGALINSKSLIGIWLFEILYAFFFLAISLKTIRLFVRNFSAFFLILFAFIIYSCTFFAFGDSVEEIILPIWAYTIYQALKLTLDNRLPTRKESLLIGVLSAIVFWLKFVHCSIFIGWYIVICILAYKKEKLKAIVKISALIVAGLLIVTLPILAFFAYNGALYNLFEVYFGCNLFNYTIRTGVVSSLSSFSLLFNHLCYTITTSPIIIFFIIISLTYIRSRKKTSIFLPLLILLLFPFIETTICSASLYYYFFPIASFSAIGYMAIVERIPSCSILKKYSVLLIIFISIIGGFELSRWNSHFLNKDSLPQYRFAKIINEKENATILEYFPVGEKYTSGFYTTAGVVPNCKYFCRTGAYPDDVQIAYQDSMINAGCFDFLVSSQCDLKFDYYTPIDSLDGYYLYKHK